MMTIVTILTVWALSSVLFTLALAVATCGKSAARSQSPRAQVTETADSILQRLHMAGPAYTGFSSSVRQAGPQLR